MCHWSNGIEYPLSSHSSLPFCSQIIRGVSRGVLLYFDTIINLQSAWTEQFALIHEIYDLWSVETTTNFHHFSRIMVNARKLQTLTKVSPIGRSRLNGVSTGVSGHRTADVGAARCSGAYRQIVRVNDVQCFSASSV